MDPKLKKKLVAATAITWSLVQLYCAFTFVLDILQVEMLHITFALMLVYLLKPGPGFLNRKGGADLFLTALSLAAGVYFLVSYPRIIERIRFVDDVLLGDYVACIASLFLVLEAGRRLMGWGLSLLGLMAIAYAFLGFLIPGTLGHSSVSLSNFTEFMVLTQEGLFGIPLRVSTTYVFLFVLFGAFLKHGRLGEFYNDLAVSVAGGLRGGPGKVAVISSSLLGTISGSAVANVSTSGTFTIPMMKRAGFSPVSAGAIEALASTGSQIVPPIMGAAAFIMAELTRIPYWTIALVAIIPSILYYVAVYSAVHFEAIRTGLGVISEQRQPLWGLLISKGYMFVPILVIIYYLGSGYSITLSATMAIISSFIISAIPIVARGKWKELGVFVEALEDGAKSSIAVAVPCAIAGVIVGVLTLTGLGLKFTEIILGLAGSNLLWLLLITSVICLVLGMGMPTSAAYITVAILAIPALIKSGMPTITAHFFGFYFANMSMITPPVALAAYAGAGLANANSAQVGVRACKMGVTLYIVPFLFATYPPLMLIGTWPEIIFAVFKAGIIVICFTAAMMSVFHRRLKTTERLLFLLAGVLLWLTIYPLLTNILGFAVLVVAVMMTLRGRPPADV
ncbi:MAG: TRAP transporter fused permease subunit [Thermodesulfobacteriota bacterium]